METTGNTSQKSMSDGEESLYHCNMIHTGTHKGHGREEDPAPSGKGLWRLKGRHWDTPGVSYVHRQDQVEEACGRPMLHTEYKGISKS